MQVIPHLIFIRNNKVLLLKRSKSQKIWPGHWHCVTGSIEKGETPSEAIIREAKEEIGLEIKSPELVSVVSSSDKDFFDDQKTFYGLEMYFLSSSDQNPVNLEPHKHDSMDWFEITNLPNPMIPVVKFGIECFMKKKIYSEFKNLTTL